MLTTRGPDGAVQIDSNRKIIMCGPNNVYTGYNAGQHIAGLFIMNGRGNRSGYRAVALDPSKAYWAQFRGNGIISSCANIFENYNGLYATNGLSINLREAADHTRGTPEGYCTVRNPGGTVIWSAAAARENCNLLQQNNFTINQGIDGNANVWVPNNPWILLNAFTSAIWYNTSINSNSAQGIMLEKSGDTYSLFCGWGVGGNGNTYRNKYGHYNVSMIFGQFY